MKFGTWFCGCGKLLCKWQTVFILDDPDRGFAQIEIDQLIQQIDLIAQNANFNGVALSRWHNAKYWDTDWSHRLMSVPAYFSKTTPHRGSRH